MQNEKRLADVIEIRNGEIRPRIDVRETFDETFGGLVPGLNFGTYLRWCERNRRKPSRDEFRRFKEFEFDGGPEAS
jgi:hypothetical protein